MHSCTLTDFILIAATMVKKEAVYMYYYGWDDLTLFCDCFLSHVLIKAMHIDCINCIIYTLHIKAQLLHRLAY